MLGKCPNCRTVLPVTRDAFCPHCREPLEADRSAQLRFQSGHGYQPMSGKQLVRRVVHLGSIVLIAAIVVALVYQALPNVRRWYLGEKPEETQKSDQPETPQQLWAYVIAGKVTQAFEGYNEILATDPDCVEALIGRAAIYHQMDETDLAQFDLDRAIELDGENAIAFNNRGSLYESLEMFDQAVADYEMALSLGYDNAPFRNSLAIVLSSSGDIDEAIRHYSEAIHLDPTNYLYYLNRGACRLKLEILTGAIEDFTKAIELKPDDVSAWICRCHAYCQMGDFDKAQVDHDEAHRLDPDWSLPALLNRQTQE